MKTLRHLLAAATVAVASQASAQITFYEGEGFEGRSFSAEQAIGHLKNTGFNDRASSAVVYGNRWEVCENPDFRGRCVVLRPGRYVSFAAMGLNDRISSVRSVQSDTRVDNDRYAPAAPSLQLTFFEGEGFAGRTFTTHQDVGDFRREGFNDRASSIVVAGGQWEVCNDVGFTGRCVVLVAGQYASLAAIGLNDRVSSVRAVAESPQAGGYRRGGRSADSAELVFYERENFTGRSLSAQQDVSDFRRSDFNDRASSVVVTGGPWEVCDTAGFRGRCIVLRPGRYASLAELGWNDRVSSVRRLNVGSRADDLRDTPRPAYDYRRRDNEVLYEANVVAVRAVVGTPEQRCWVEREQIAQDRNNANVPAAIAGAVIGGILGHQVGGGRGKDLATAGGAVAGALIGSNIGRNDSQANTTQDVQRCTSMPNQSRPDYWDVTYHFRGQEHRVQMLSPPGPTVTVNAQGEPRA